MAEQFSWMPFYEEAAHKLLEWEGRQVELITFLEDLRSQGLPVTNLQDKDEQGNALQLTEIDPFTVFGSFNRQLTPENRIVIIKAIKGLLGVQAVPPADFDGVPVLNNQKSWFFSFKAKRSLGDIPALWRVFRAAMGANPQSDPEFTAAFDAAINVRGVNINLTMGLYWIRPKLFLGLDQTNRSHLKIDLPSEGLTANAYLEVLNRFQGQLFPELSYAAWRALAKGAEAAPLNTESVQSGSVWFVGAYWSDEEPTDQTDRFLAEGIWQNGYIDKYLDVVRSMSVGDRIAIKTAVTQKNGLPFDARGHTVSRMTIKAIGSVVANRGDGKTIEVEWAPNFQPKHWYFYTDRRTVWRLNTNADHHNKELVERLIRYTFDNAPQDYDWFVQRWYGEGGNQPGAGPADGRESAKPYAVADALAEGVFLSEAEVTRAVQRLKTKRNLILQGPPGVGKTFLARKLAYALMEVQDDSRVGMVQFHQTYSYEDFIRGYRPSASQAGHFELRDGVFYRFCEKAREEPELEHVFIIDEINRGNLSQIFGELLMLIEADKRGKAFAIPLVYEHKGEKPFDIPDNVYIIGLMNLSDRSLAMVDYALRRRFAFIDLEPRFSSSEFRNWLQERNMKTSLIDLIIDRMNELNKRIREDSLLGDHYQVGHSFFCPKGDFGKLERAWYDDVIETEIVPLLKEYWSDDHKKLIEVSSLLLKQ